MTEYRLIQNGQVVARTSGNDAFQAINRYAMVYEQDGHVQIESRKNTKAKWKEVS